MSSSSASTSSERNEEPQLLPVPPRVFREWKGLNLRFETIWESYEFRRGSLISSDGQKIYAVGAGGNDDELWCLDLSQDDQHWTFLSRMPVRWTNFTCVQVGNMIIVVDNGDDFPNMICYDIDTNEWTRSEIPFPRCIAAVALNSHDLLYVNSLLLGNRNPALVGKYNFTEGSSESLTVRMKGGYDVKNLIKVGDHKVVIFTVPRGQEAPRRLECSFIDVRADKLVSLPPLTTTVNDDPFPVTLLKAVAVENFLFVALQFVRMQRCYRRGVIQVIFRLLDLERPSLGWHIIDGLEECHFAYRIEELFYREDEKCILACSHREVRELDMSAVFNTGSFKYKATIPRFVRKEDPDGLLAYILAQGNALTQPFLNYRVLQSRMDILCSVQPRSRNQRQIEAVKDADTEEEGDSRIEPITDDHRKMPAKAD